ncbi:MAG: hypothetical protein KatS3mg105_5031 [Gemmatales bacterium]|nr:MAG: hypothetical protein KatS3mg105_5031 [Gemmatales bacterium]
MLAFLLFSICLQDPLPLPQQELEKLVGELESVRKQIADLKAKELELSARIKEQWKKWSDKLKSLGLLDGPIPQPDQPENDEMTEFQKKLIDAFKKDEASLEVKKKQASVLQEIYRIAVKESANPECSTCEELAFLIQSAINTAPNLGPNALKQIREIVRSRLQSVAPDLSVALTSELRLKVASIYSEAAKVLEVLSK